MVPAWLVLLLYKLITVITLCNATVGLRKLASSESLPINSRKSRNCANYNQDGMMSDVISVLSVSSSKTLLGSKHEVYTISNKLHIRYRIKDTIQR